MFNFLELLKDDTFDFTLSNFEKETIEEIWRMTAKFKAVVFEPNLNKKKLVKCDTIQSRYIIYTKMCILNIVYHSEKLTISLR